MDLIESAQGEARHPWETTRYGFFKRLITETRELRGARVLDVGSGDAWLATRLARETSPREMVCVDANYTASDIERLRALHPAVEFTATPVDRRFDVLMLLDVAEHVQDDIGLVKTLVDRSLAEGGLVVFSVPAWPQLWTSHDVALHHFRRYTPQQARTVLESAGLRVVRQGGAYATLPLPRSLTALRERIAPPKTPPRATGPWTAPPAITRWVERALEADLAITGFAERLGASLPCLSVWALCEHPR